MSMPYLPEEIVIDILSRLPVRSLLRFWCVSKSWRFLISSPDFAQSHLRKTLISPTLRKNREGVLLNHFPLQSINYNSPAPITDLHHPLLNSGTRVQILGSCNGLVCLRIGLRVILYNPATRKFRSIEVPSSPSPLPDDKGECWGFGFDSNVQEYKVVRRVWGRGFQVQVLRLVGSDQAIVCREVCCDHVVEQKQTGVFLNGSIHWQADLYRRHGDVIVRFDLAREVFDEMPAPLRPRGNVLYHGLGVLEDCLSVLQCLTDFDKLWVMKEYGIWTSWTVFFVLPRYIGTKSLYYLRPVTFKSVDEILLDIVRQGREIVIFNLQEGTFETICAAGNQEFSESTVYVESLVSP